MILTGKAKDDFKKWLAEYRTESFNEATGFKHFSRVCKDALLIHWFDSVYIYIRIEYRSDYKHWACNVEASNGTDYERGYSSRQEATKQAILKANDLYNETNKAYRQG